MADRTNLSVRETILAARPIPCICPRQHEKAPPIGVTIAIHIARAIEIERVRCNGCARTWTRINA